MELNVSRILLMRFTISDLISKSLITSSSLSLLTLLEVELRRRDIVISMVELMDLERILSMI
jgi:hypothetical protein